MERILYTLTMMLVSFMVNAQSCPDNYHPHAIDLGLPSGTKWACSNVGATTPEGYGDYFAWGETEKKEKYDWTTYIHCDGSMETCHDLGLDIAGTEYDVAHVQWGGTWVMPSQDQIRELISKCSYICTDRNGVLGDLFTGPNGATIFLPEANEWKEDCHNSADTDFFNNDLDSETDELPDVGYYWASTQRTSNLSHASCILCSNGYAWDTYNYRSSGLTVRPVMSETTNYIRSKISTDDACHDVFDLQGRRLQNKPSKGVYVSKGRKVIR